MKHHKTKLVVKIDPHRNWIVLDESKIVAMAQVLKKKAELMMQAALTPCQDCGKAGVVVHGNRLLRVCASCAMKRLNRLLSEDDDGDDG